MEQDHSNNSSNEFFINDDSLSASKKLERDEKENVALFGSIAHTEASFSCDNVAEVPERYFYPDNDSLFLTKPNDLNVTYNLADRVVLAGEDLPKIDELTELIKKLRLDLTTKTCPKEQSILHESKIKEISELISRCKEETGAACASITKEQSILHESKIKEISELISRCKEETGAACASITKEESLLHESNFKDISDLITRCKEETGAECLSDDVSFNEARINKIVEYFKQRCLDSSSKADNIPAEAAQSHAEQKQIAFEVSNKYLNFPSVKVGESFVQQFFLKNKSNTKERIKLTFAPIKDSYDYFQFIVDNKSSKEMAIEVKPAETLKFRVLFSPLKVGKFSTYINVESESGGCQKLVDVLGYSGEIIFTFSLPFNPESNQVSVIFNTIQNFNSFIISNFGDVKLFFVFGESNENLMNVIPHNGIIMPMDSCEITVSIHKFKTIAENIDGGIKRIKKFTTIPVLYGYQADLHRIYKLYCKYETSHSEIFSSRLKELKLISTGMKGCLDEDIEDGIENFDVLWLHSVKMTSIDVSMVRSQLHDDNITKKNRSNPIKRLGRESYTFETIPTPPSYDACMLGNEFIASSK